MTLLTSKLLKLFLKKNEYDIAVFNKKKEYDLALKDFNKAIRLNDKDGQYFMNRSYTNYFKANKDAALKDALQAKKLGFAVKNSYIEKVKNLKIE